MSARRLMIPLLNREVVTFGEAMWHLGENVVCRTILDGDYGAVWRYLEDQEATQYRGMVTSETKCVYVEDIPSRDGHEGIDLSSYVEEKAIVIQSVLNLFASDIAVLTAFAVVLRVSSQDEGTQRTSEVEYIVDLEPVANLHLLITQAFILREAASERRMNQAYRVISQVASKYEPVLVTLSRFNCSLTRATANDRIIDLTISLESLIGQRNELRFKFAAYLSCLVGANPQERLEAFGLLAALYDARSALVHGTGRHKSAKKSLQKVLEDWDCVLRVARTAVFYYMAYLYSEIQGDVSIKWNEHLKRLLLGVDSRIVD